MFVYLCPQLHLMSRRTLGRQRGELMKQAKLQLDILLQKQAWVGTTADSCQAKKPLGEVIHAIHQEFGIASKVVATTTDNGANHVAAFDAFGKQEGVVAQELCDVQGQLAAEDIDTNLRITLPPCRRCCVHSMNLMATADLSEVMGCSRGNTPWRKAFANAQYLWNLQNRSPIAANQIKAAIKRKLLTPAVVSSVRAPTSTV
ncbi:uncharacterized protein LOC109518643 [Hippocampus comes]|uniref:uncharacterized protein LOC109518643 n=1 Tax=Hippocampus comes TaxID=109280 RepID=UPI00094EED60|nr:PREDICTED: uncharacterized protein LOC109518643 [Hippocampus comes]